jgi:hypothetical protein
MKNEHEEIYSHFDTVERARDMLACIPVGAHDERVQVAFALQDAVGDDGFSLFDDWYKGRGDSYDASESRDVWRSARGAGGVTARTLTYLAKKYGWSDSGKHTPLTGVALREMQLEQAREALKKAEREEEVKAATAELAQRLLDESDMITEGNPNPYLQYKQVKPTGELRQLDIGTIINILGYVPKSGVDVLEGQVLIVPIRNIDGKLMTAELIDECGAKTALRGKGTKSGGFFSAAPIDKVKSVDIAEGVATALTWEAVTGVPTIAAMSLSGVKSLAATIKRAGKQVRIIADTKRRTEVGDAVTVDQSLKNTMAKQSIKIIAPRFDPLNARELDLTDMNDLFVLHGANAVRACLDEAPAPASPSVDDVDWESLLHVKETKGGPVPEKSAWNYYLYLQNHPYFKGRIRYDEFNQRINFDGRPLTDSLIASVKIQLERHVVNTSAVGTAFREAIDAIAEEPSARYHPVRDYLTGVAWDGKSRLERFFIDYLGVEDNAYHRGVAKAFFAQAVQRIFEPGSKADYTVILHGLQGVKKSTLWEELGGAFYSEITESMDSRDFQMSLVGSWLADLGELSAFKRAEWARIKSILTSRKDKVRKAYGRFHEHFERQCVFVASTNEHEWLKDPTGGRRFLPIHCVIGKIDTGKLVKERDALWAEAYYWYKNGLFGEWWEIEDAAAQQEDLMEQDAWHDTIKNWLLVLSPEDREAIRIDNILDQCLQIKIKDRDQLAKNRVGKVLRMLGYEMKKIKRSGRQVKAWVCRDSSKLLPKAETIPTPKPADMPAPIPVPQQTPEPDDDAAPIIGKTACWAGCRHFQRDEQQRPLCALKRTPFPVNECRFFSKK